MTQNLAPFLLVFVPLIGYLLANAASSRLTTYYHERDGNFHLPLPFSPLPPEFYRSGRVTVSYTNDELSNLVDDRGMLPSNASVEIAYHTSFSSDKPECQADKHILLVHGTDMIKDLYYWTKQTLKISLVEHRNKNMAAALSPQLESKSKVDRYMRNRECVSLPFDLRGHGNSTVTPGPWSVPLLAADVTKAIRIIHGNAVKVHAYGLSIGLGIVLKMAIDYPETVWTVSGGGGCLANMRANSKWAPYIFSRTPVVQAMGLERLAEVGEMVLQCKPKGFLKNIMHYATLQGHLHASQSSLYFNEVEKLRSLSVPVLWQYPIRDDSAGYLLFKVQREFGMLPKSYKNKIFLYSESGDEGHCYSTFDPDRVFGDVLDFVRENANSNPTHSTQQ